jgi:hypothetical protein
VIKLPVREITLVILVALAYHGDADDDDEGGPGCEGVDGGDNADGEEDGDDEEVDVGQAFELQQQGLFIDRALLGRKVMRV